MPIPRADLQVETAVVGIPLTEWRQADLAAMGITGTSGDHFLNLSTNVITLKSNTPSSSTVTDISYCQVTLPPSYQAGTDVTFRVYAAVEATADTNTIDLSAYEVTQTTGAVSSDLCATNAQNVTATAAAIDFTITGSSLEPGAILTLKVTTVNTDADGAVGTTTIPSTALVMSTRG